MGKSKAKSKGKLPPVAQRVWQIEPLRLNIARFSDTDTLKHMLCASKVTFATALSVLYCEAEEQVLAKCSLEWTDPLIQETRYEMLTRAVRRITESVPGRKSLAPLLLQYPRLSSWSREEKDVYWTVEWTRLGTLECVNIRGTYLMTVEDVKAARIEIPALASLGAGVLPASWRIDWDLELDISDVASYENNLHHRSDSCEPIRCSLLRLPEPWEDSLFSSLSHPRAKTVTAKKVLDGYLSQLTVDWLEMDITAEDYEGGWTTDMISHVAKRISRLSLVCRSAWTRDCWTSAGYLIDAASDIRRLDELSIQCGMLNPPVASSDIPTRKSTPPSATQPNNLRLLRLIFDYNANQAATHESTSQILAKLGHFARIAYGIGGHQCVYKMALRTRGVRCATIDYLFRQSFAEEIRLLRNGGVPAGQGWRMLAPSERVGPDVVAF